MYKPNAAIQFYMGLYGKKGSDFDPSISLWSNIMIAKYERDKARGKS